MGLNRKTNPQQMSQITKFFRAANKHAPMRSAQGGALVEG